MSSTPDPRPESETPPSLLEERPSIPAAEPRLDTRRGFLTSDSMLIVAGLWMVASPTVLSLEGEAAKWLTLICGALITPIAAFSLAGLIPRVVASWAVVGLGAVLFVGGVLLGESPEADWNAAAGGAVVAFLGIIAVLSSDEGEGPRA